jgi:putative ABC transport system permease protein
MDRWIRDFTHAGRSLARTPGFTVVVVATLALAIGANATIFSVVDAVLLQPLPFPNADRLVYVGGTAPGTDQPEELGVPDELYFEYRESVPGLEDIALYGVGSSTTRAEGQVDQLFVSRATPSMFTTLGAQPQRGRLPTDADNENVVVISDWLWRSWFGSDENVIGRSYVFAGGNRTVIGVMKPEFRFPDERVAFWVPFTLRAAQVTPGGFGPRAVARMKPGTERSALAAQLEPLARRVQQRLGGPAPYVRIMERHRPVVKPLREHLVGNVSAALWILLGTVGIVFVIACANVNDRAAMSRFQYAFMDRLKALPGVESVGYISTLPLDEGASRWQGGRVALVGILVGTLAAVGLTRYIATLLFDVGQLDGLAFAGMSAVMFAVALLASYVPARRASRVDPAVALRAE